MSSIEFETGGGDFITADVRVNIANMPQALRAIAERTRARRGYTLFTVNLDHLVKLRRDRRFGEAYHRADFVTADGWPIVWHMSQHGHKLERTTGADLLEPVCRQAAEQATPIYFVGPGVESQAAALDVLIKRLPGLIVAGTESPRFSSRLDDDAVEAMARRISESGASLCVISLGAPKQELLADMLHARCPDVGFLCFGAALDFISGHAVRAPLWMQRTGVEWLWRLSRAPQRMIGRYSQCGLAFVKLAFPGVFPLGIRLRGVGLAENEEAAI